MEKVKVKENVRGKNGSTIRQAHRSPQVKLKM